MKVLFDCTETAHSRQQSGIPQVVRNLWTHYPEADREMVIRDRYTGWWRWSDAREKRWMEPHHHIEEDGKERAWGDWQKIRGWLQARLGKAPPLFGKDTALVVPELYFPAGGRAFGEIQARCGGPVVAIFHDAVAIRHPEFAPPFVADNFSAYLEDLVHLDAVAAVSEASRKELVEYWKGKGWTQHPPVVVIPLGTSLRPHGSADQPAGDAALPLVLFVSTIEPRKNHAAALAVAERLWAEGLRFRLEFAGGCNAEVREEWQHRLKKVKAPEGCFTYHGRVSRERLRQLYQESRFTVYPSHWEGFGLPALESLSFGKPCLCSDRGGLAEVAAGGGCLIIDPDDREQIARDWRCLLTDSALYDSLVGQARQRNFRTWEAYAGDVENWLRSVHKRPAPFVEACRHPEVAGRFLQPSVRELAAAAQSLRERWTDLEAARETFHNSIPGRTFPVLSRAEDLGDWQDGGTPVSLDIFDTCLVRQLEKPEDVFQLLGQTVERLTGFQAGKFATMRGEIENALRQQGLEQGTREDTRLEDIYRELGQQLSWDSATGENILSAELELERFFLRPVPAVRERAWELHRTGRLLAYTSEMYLPGEALRGLLAGAGFPVDGVAVLSSGETGKSKGTGNLYRLLLEKAGDQQVLHVGDNPVSDGTVPAALGIATAIIRTGKEHYPDSLSNVLQAAVLQPAFSRDQFWENFGYRVAGPVHFAFAAFLYRQCVEQGRESLYFLSRDGWFPKIVFDRLQEAWGPVANSHYLYASREYFGLGSMTDIGPAEWDFLLKASPLLKVRDAMARIGLSEATIASACAKHGLGDPDRLLCHHWGYRDPEDRDRLYAAICDNLEEFILHKARIRENLAAYLDASGIFAQPSLFMDVGWGASSFKSLQAMAPEPIRQPAGLYFALLSGSPDGVTDYFTAGSSAQARIHLLKGSIALMEFLFGSPEPTVGRMEKSGDAWTPVFKEAWPQYDLSAWTKMESGIRQFADSLLGVQPQPAGGDGVAFVEDTLRRLIFLPQTDELHALGPVVHGEGWGTGNRLRMIPRTDLLSTPAALHEAMCYAPWKSGLAALAD